MCPEPASFAQAHAWLNAADADLCLAAIAFLFGSVDAIPGREPEPSPRAARIVMAENRLIRACADRDPHCGCDLPTCRAMMGDCDEGGKSSRENCLRCLTAWSLA